MNTNVVSRRALTIALAALAMGAHAQTTLYTFDGDLASDQFGKSVSDVGDVNGDGRADFIVGVPLGSNLAGVSTGLARVYSGADGSILHTVYGDSVGDRFGFSVSGAADVNNDGVPDFIVSAPLDDDNGSASGSARVFSGFDGSILHTLYGDSVGDRFGFSVSGTGDVDGDGCADLIVGSPFDTVNGQNSGKAEVFSGRTGFLLYSLTDSTEGDQFGFSVSGAGDVTGDGIADFIVGAPSDEASLINSGSARVYSGSSGSVRFTLYGQRAWASLGHSVSDVGDVDGDGRDDFIIGAPGAVFELFAGRAWVFSGRNGKPLYTFDAGWSFAFSVSGAGDVDGDGLADFIVGERFFRNDDGVDVGRANVYAGKEGSILHTYVGDSPFGQFGHSVSGAGDVDGDGLADIIVGTLRPQGNLSSSVSVFTVPFTPLNPAVEIVENLMEDVVVLNLSVGIENSLDAKLDAIFLALNDMVDGNDGAVIVLLESFVIQVQAQSGNKITVEDADALIASAQAIIDLLTST